MKINNSNFESENILEELLSSWGLEDINLQEFKEEEEDILQTHNNKVFTNTDYFQNLIDDCYSFLKNCTPGESTYCFTCEQKNEILNLCKLMRIPVEVKEHYELGKLEYIEFVRLV